MIFGADNPISINCLNELRKQQIIDERVYGMKLIKHRVRKWHYDRHLVKTKKIKTVLTNVVTFKVCFSTLFSSFNDEEIKIQGTIHFQHPIENCIFLRNLPHCRIPSKIII